MADSAAEAGVVERESVRVLETPVAALRTYAIVYAPTSLFFERTTTLVQMLEHPVAKSAPHGAMLLRDSDDGDRSVVCAERVLDGWVMREAST